MPFGRYYNLYMNVINDTDKKILKINANYMFNLLLKNAQIEIPITRKYMNKMSHSFRTYLLTIQDVPE